ncbi:MAG: carboxylesterase family protein, partial [[Eubacterium] sulci]|nr:carboxylesterase family protein [[Eubacterium] sulci]
MRKEKFAFYSFLILVTIVFELYMFLNRNAWSGLILVLVTAFIITLYWKKTRKGGRAVIAMFILFALISFISLPKEKLVPATYEGAKRTGKIEVKEGRLTGVYNKDRSVEVYAGIPYAKAPVGDLRWKEPKNPEKYKGVLRADHFQPMAMQKRTNRVVSSATDIFFYHNVTRT